MLKNGVNLKRGIRALAIVFAIGWIFSFTQVQAATTIGANISTDGYLKIGTAVPGVPVVGMIYYDSGTNKFRCYEGAPAGWVDCIGGVSGTLPVSGGGTGFTSYALGDLLYGNAGGTLNKLPIGLDGDMLTVAGGALTWQAYDPLVITNTFPVASQAAMLAAGALKGDVAIRSDESKSYICTTDPCTVLGNWTELVAPTNLALLKANNLSDVANVATSRTNLGLGTGDSPTFNGLNLNAGATISGAGALTLDSAAALNIGNTNATSIFLGRSGIDVTVNGDFNIADYIDFNTIIPPATNRGRLFYDSVQESMSYYTDIPDLEVNIGQRTLIRVKNETGSPITADSIVYINGATTTGIPTVDLAQANSTLTSKALGMSSKTIADSAEGFVTTFGMIYDQNTSTYTAGDPIYLSPTTPGAFQTARPFGDYEVPVGFIGKSDATTGTILIYMGTKVATAISQGEIGFGNASGYIIGDGTNLFWDNTNKRLGIGTNTPAHALDVTGNIHTGALLLLGQTNSFPLTDPAGGVNGAMYYDLQTTKFRCFENGRWVNCINAGGSSAFSSLTASSAINTIDNLNFAQTWNWSTSSNQNPLSLSANSLTSGNLLSLSSSATGLAGNLADLQVTGDNAGVTGKVLNINVSGATAAAVPLNITNNGTGLSFRVNDSTGDITPFVIDNAGQVGIGKAAPGATLDVQGEIRLSGATSGYVGLVPVVAGGSITYTLPSSDGTIGQVLKTNGSGVLDWTSITGTVNSGTALDNTLRWDGTNWIETANVKSSATGTLTLATGQAYTGAGAVTLSSAAAANLDVTSGTTGNLTLDSGTSGLVNLGTNNNAKTINVATGTAGNTVNIATDDTTADAVNIGSAKDALAITSTGFNVASGAVSLKPAGAITTEQRFLELAANGINYVGFKAPDAVGVANPIWTLPAADGTIGQVLKTNGSGVLDWTSISGTVNSGTATSNTLRWDGANWVENTTLLADGSSNLQIGATNVGTLKISDGSANFVSISTQPITTNYTLNLPGSDGTLGQVLKTDGSGNLSWTSISGTVNSGTALDNTLRWDGTNWIETANVKSSAAGTLTLAAGQSYTGAGAVTLSSAATANLDVTSGTTGNLTLDSGTSGLVNLGTNNNAKTINVATGTAGNTVNIATDDTTADAVNIGSAKDALAITSTGFNVASGAVSLKPAGAITTEQRFLELAGNGSSYVGFKSADSLAGNQIWTLPVADGTTGQVLKTNGSGVLDWTTITGTVNSGTALDNTLRWNGTNWVETANVKSSAAGTLTLAAGQAYTSAGAVTLSSGAGGSLTLNSDTTGTIDIGTDANAESINIGTGLAAKALILGSTNTSSATTVNAGSGGVTVGTLGSGVVHSSGSGLLSSSAVSLTADVSGQLPLANGGTNANLTAVDGGIFYSTATAAAISAAGTSGQFLKSNGAAAPTWQSVSTVPAGTTDNSTLRWDSGATAWQENTTFKTNAGDLTGVSSIDTISTSATALTFAGAGTIAPGGANTLTLGSTNTTSITNIQSGTGNINLLPASTGKVTIGTSDTVGTTLVLDIKTDSGHPTGTAGAMYYNSDENKFKCYEAGAWKNCDTAGSLQASYNIVSVDNALITTTISKPITFTTPSGANNIGLIINQNDTANNPVALQITNAGTGNDITAPNWSITKNGIFSTSGNINATGGGAITSSGVLTGQLGLTVTGGAVSLNSGISNTSINTGTSTGTVTIGNASSTAVKIGKLTTNGVVLTSGGDGTLTSSATLPVANGGTGIATTPTNGQLLIGNGTNYTLAGLTAGTGITITPGAGTITIAASTGLPAGTINNSTLRYNTGTSTWQENTTFLASAGALAGVSSLDTISTSATSLGFAGTGTLSSGAETALNITAGTGTTGVLTLDSGTTGAVNVGTGASAKTITIGSSSSTAVKIGKLDTQWGLVYTSATDGTLAQVGAGTTGQCLNGNTGAAPTWGSCGSGASAIPSNVQNSTGTAAIALSTSEQQITSVTITPSLSTSRVMINGFVQLNKSVTNSTPIDTIRIKRGGTNCATATTQVGVDADSSSKGSTSDRNNVAFSFVDSPVTDSATTYRVCGITTVANDTATKFSIVVMEIGQ